MQKIALWLALAALGVNAPRFVILFLKVDSIYLPRGLEGFLLAITGIATGTVLSGGGAYIAHVLAHETRGSSVRAFLTISWILLLVFNVILLAPMMVVAVRMSELAYVLDTPGQQWLWSIIAIVAVEWLAGGAMAAYALLDRNRRSDPLDDLLARLTGGLHAPLPSGTPMARPEENGAVNTRKQRQA
jgi:hypothetical protein